MRLFKRFITLIKEFKTLLLGVIALYIFGLVSLTLLNEKELLEHYAWFFIITTTTVGYGDFYPKTNEGRLVIAIIVLVGIGLISELISNLISKGRAMEDMKRYGSYHYDNIKNHIVIFGYRGSVTHKIIDEVYEAMGKIPIIVCSENTPKNPFANLPDYKGVHFVKGVLGSNDVLTRANVKAATQIIVYGVNDEQSFLTAVSIREINDSSKLIIFLEQQENEGRIKMLKGDNQVILPLYPSLIVREMLNKGTASLIQDLTSNLSGDTIYSYVVEHIDTPITYKKAFIHLFEQYNITLLGVYNSIEQKLYHNISSEQTLQKGDSLFYKSSQRLSPKTAIFDHI